MAEPTTLQAIVTRHLDAYAATHPLDARRRAVCRHIAQCRTAALGGLQLQCTRCDTRATRYFACRDRHCPQCQWAASRRWSSAQQRDVLPVDYFHLVFTLPEAINGWVRLHPEVIYRLLFAAVWSTLKRFGADPRRLGGELGMTAVLHTWGQTLGQHLHLHCLVPGGALSASGDWRAARSTYLFPVRALSRGFRGAMVGRLRTAWEQGDLPGVNAPDEPRSTLDRLMQRDWVVFSRPTRHASAAVIRYLSRYTHRVAIGNERLLSMEEGRIRFRYTDYRDDRRKVMELSADEFLRRLLLHVLPKGLMRIRHYGFLANSVRAKRLPQVRTALAAPPDDPEPSRDAPLPANDLPCPNCPGGRMRVVGEVAPRRTRRAALADGFG